MARVITVTGNDIASLRRSIQTALTQISSELDRMQAELTAAKVLIEELEARVTALEP